jgi:hypothetical protein
MKCVQFVLSAVLLTLTTVWARAAALGLEQAFVSIAVESCVKSLRAKGYFLNSIGSSDRLGIF